MADKHAERAAVFDRLQAEHLAKLQALDHSEIDIEFPDGKCVKGKANETTPFKALEEAYGANNNYIAVLVDDNKYHIMEPLAASCKITPLSFDDPKGKEVFWHSSAHVLGYALEELYDAVLGTGPALETGGFYYDARLPEGQVFQQEDLPKIQKKAIELAKRARPFIQLRISKEEALEMFSDNKYKIELITKNVKDGESCTVFRCGNFIDFCVGPHVSNTKLVRNAFNIYKCSSAYWQKDQANDSLQRVYGISFPEKAQLEKWQHDVEELENRKHMKIATDQELVLAHPLAPGCPIFLPHGTRIYRALENLIRDVYWRQHYEEVQTPTFYNIDLWKRSGHWDFYKDDMFSFDVDEQKYGLKPMNCPGHCLIFGSRPRSIHELPLRLADFGELHRNELSGALRGLTRLRRFHQDDAHIYCTRDQIQQEVKGVLQFIQDIYGIFGFTFKLGLSTRPEHSIGSDENWEYAESALRKALDEFGKPYEIFPGDGAFYGPKIDIQLLDALGRCHQCATCQLDFNLPERFKLRYQSPTGLEQPVMVHRAVLGSVERFMAILTEHVAGMWPFWVSPRQCYILSMKPGSERYAQDVYRLLRDEMRFYCDIDVSSTDPRKKVSNALKEKYNFVVCVGPKDEADGTVTVRERGKGDARRTLPLMDFAKELDEMRKQRK